ncbi:DNA-directed RNA polymerase subunit delta [Malacoplasma iowae]|uniref:DNA-directed RNA polymerase subunit delta n=1 Tax=Malacoplasma iowae TaxID=2116 RepID=UPI0038738E77|nr:DNA-directed RNA polymerase subunit delta [Malacoplasma iowae]
MERHLIDTAYDCAKKNFGESPFTFKELYELLLKSNPLIKNEAIDLYIEILQDIRFISLGKQKWSLRENYTNAEINKITSSMFGLEEYHEEDADKYMSDAEKHELHSKEEKEEQLDLIIDEEEGTSSPRKTPTIQTDDIEEDDDMDKTVISSHGDDGSSSDDEPVDDDDDDEIVLDDDEVEVDDDLE